MISIFLLNAFKIRLWSWEASHCMLSHMLNREVKITATTSTTSIWLYFSESIISVRTLFGNSACVYQITECACQLFGHMELP